MIVRVIHIRKRLIITVAVTLAVVLATLFFVRPGTRSLQVWGFLLSFAALYAAADGRGKLASRIGTCVYALALWLTLVDSGIRGFLYATYRTDYFSGFVLDSLANTHESEAGEFILSQMGHFLPWIAMVALSGALCTGLLIWAGRARDLAREKVLTFRRSFAVVWIAVIALFTAITWSKSSWRGQLPGFSWMKVYQYTEETRAKWADTLRETKQALQQAERLITHVDKTPNTLVFVIGESMTSENMSVYGYVRDTTPQIREMAQKGEITAISDSWSTEHSTIAAFNSMFKFSGGGEHGVNLLALFDAAGYRITWISNQDDTAIKAQYMALSDRVVTLNHLGGRSTVSLDEKVLEPLKAALQEPYERKLIVVHLIGCHPHYSLRYPDGLKGGWESTPQDPVQDKLNKLERSRFVRRARDHYDRAILYQDGVIAQSLRLTQRNAASSNAFWCYLSDHGQEVGTYADWDGHSNTTPSGYRIPLLIWARGKEKANIGSASGRSFRADWVDSMLLESAGIHWRGEALHESVLNPIYRWKNPKSKQKFLQNQVPMVELQAPN
jgi:heptose-I-phosphate ethanolaminephosphotransferase